VWLHSGSAQHRYEVTSLHSVWGCYLGQLSVGTMLEKSVCHHRGSAQHRCKIPINHNVWGCVLGKQRVVIDENFVCVIILGQPRVGVMYQASTMCGAASRVSTIGGHKVTVITSKGITSNSVTSNSSTSNKLLITHYFF
jgi:hypothetical protein